MFSLYFTLQIKQDIKHKQKTTRETRGNLEQSFARELLGNGNSSLAARGALAHRLQHCTTAK